MRAPLLFLLPLFLVVPGCFRYVPVQEVPPQSTPVRVGLSRPVAIELADLTANNIVEVRGEVVSARPDRIVLSAFALRSVGEFEYPGNGETVVLPREAVARLEQKRLAPGRTALFTGALVAAAYAVRLVLTSVGGDGDGGGGTPPSK